MIQINETLVKLIQLVLALEGLVRFAQKKDAFLLNGHAQKARAVGQELLEVAQKYDRLLGAEGLLVRGTAFVLLYAPEGFDLHPFQGQLATTLEAVKRLAVAEGK